MIEFLPKILLGVGILVAFFIILKMVKAVLSLRRVVPTNEVHIVQRAATTTSYGKDTADKKGNSYYEWPSWLPVIGVNKIVLPVSVFKLELDSYDAYDMGRLPFEIDVVAFFRVVDSNMAAARVSSVDELYEQLEFIVKGAARTTLASYDIDKIMVERATFGDHFTKEVEGQLTNWGVAAVKNIELMDIRDSGDNKVIQNIMAKKKSQIESESRSEVAKNMQDAQIAEVNAAQQVQLQQQAAEQTVGLRKAEVTSQVGIANEKAQQEIKEQARVTKEKEMAVAKVGIVQQANIDKEANEIKAEQDKQVTIKKAEATLETEKRNAEAVTLNGNAKAAAESAMQMAPVTAQIALAKEIGENKEYQTYLITMRQVEANQAIGIEQAQNLGNADIKIIGNTGGGNIKSGVDSVLELFSAKGGTEIASMVTAMAQTEEGQGFLNKFTKPKE